MHSERECYEETMKKAFMRGVCALNMEAMNIFKGETDTNEVFKRNHFPPTSNPITPYQTSQSANGCCFFYLYTYIQKKYTEIYMLFLFILQKKFWYIITFFFFFFFSFRKNRKESEFQSSKRLLETK